MVESFSKIKGWFFYFPPIRGYYPRGSLRMNVYAMMVVFMYIEVVVKMCGKSLSWPMHLLTFGLIGAVIFISGECVIRARMWHHLFVAKHRPHKQPPIADAIAMTLLALFLLTTLYVLPFHKMEDPDLFQVKLKSLFCYGFLISVLLAFPRIMEIIMANWNKKKKLKPIEFVQHPHILRRHASIGSRLRLFIKLPTLFE